MSTSVEQRIIKIAAETLKLNENDITLESKVVDDLGADSLDQVELMMAIEADFKVDIPDEDATKISTISDAVQYVKQKMSN